jgi:5-methyltetrahydrofolate--homocysteine methyltransferase
MDYGFYHMDGKGQIPHLDHLLSIPRLRGIQWQPGAGAPLASEWLDLLRRIRDGGKLCQVYVTPEGALKIKRELGGRGFLLAVGFEDDKLTPQEAVEFLDAFYS